MTTPLKSLDVSVEAEPGAEAFASIAIQTETTLSDDVTRPYRFTIHNGGRALWQQWFDHKPIFIREGAAMYEAQIAAFPTNPRTDYGYIKLVRTV